MTSLLTRLGVGVVLWASANSALAQDAIRFGIAEEPYPPFTIKDASGGWTGWEVEIRNAVCKQMDADCAWVETALDDLVPALRAKRIDIIWSSLAITDDNRKLIDFTAKYYATPTSLAGGKDLAATADPDGLRGKTIGVEASTAQLAYAKAHYTGVARDIKIYQSQDDLNQDLASGRVDAGLADAITIAAFLDTDAGRACCKLLGTVADDPKTLGLGFGGGVRREETALRDRISAAIAAIRASGTFDTITRKYFTVDIYGR